MNREALIAESMHQCPERRFKEVQDLCALNDKICLLEEGLECEEWAEIRKEWENGRNKHRYCTQNTI
jgi:hypothetical protein